MSALFVGSDTEHMRDGESPLRLGKAEREHIHALYLAHSPALTSYARSLGFSRDAAEDLLQETFLAAVRRIDALRSCAYPRAYLMQILRNVVGYRLRSMKYAAGLEEKLQREARERAGPEGPEEGLGPEVLYRGLIGDSELRLLLRFYVEGRSVGELARELEIDPGACKMRIKRARERLRAALEKDGGEERGR